MSTGEIRRIGRHDSECKSSGGHRGGRSSLHRSQGWLAICLTILLTGCAGMTSPTLPPPPPAEVASPTLPSPPPPEPGPSGVYHVLERGQTLSSVARVYQVEVSTLMEVNGVIDATKIPAGSSLFIPGAIRVLPVTSTHTLALAWPLRGRITSRFGPRARRSVHEGLDIDGTLGQVVRAAAGGKVIPARAGRGYGLSVEIDHGEGWTTFYAHASKLLVQVGDPIQQGDPVAKVGQSGNASGTHLHFELRRNGRPVDPLAYLR